MLSQNEAEKSSTLTFLSSDQTEINEAINKGPAELLHFLEESFTKIETNIRHNNQVIQKQAEAILSRVEDLEVVLQTVMHQLGEFASDADLQQIEATPDDVMEPLVQTLDMGPLT